MSVKRFAHLKLDAKTSKLDSSGFLRTTAYATRTGIFLYKNDKGQIIRELRPPDEVFHPDSVATLKMVPITNTHPKQGRVTSENAKELAVGATGSVEVEDPYLKTEVVVNDKKAVEAIMKDGREQLSCGYDCVLDWTPGEWNGEKYDAIQTEIRYNHLALEDRGRAGPQVRLHLDAGDAEEIEKPEGGKVKITIDGKEFEVADEVGKAFNSAVKKHEDAIDAVKDELKTVKADSATLKTDAADLKKKADKVEAERDTLKEKLDKKGDDVNETEIQKRVKARVQLEKVANDVLDEKALEKMDALNDLDLKKEIIKASRPTLNLDGKSEDYINASFDLVREDASDTEESHRDLGQKLSAGARKDAQESEDDVPDADAARKKFIKDSEEMWKKSASNSAN